MGTDGMVRNMPTPEGRVLGVEMARLCDVAESEQRKRFPNHAERCQSCAFRAGTLPNGCPDTLMDAVKCVLEAKPFYCHEVPNGQQPSELCAGWTLLMADRPAINVPWAFSA